MPEPSHPARLRSRVEATSVPLLERLGRFPAWLVALVVGALVAVALVVGSGWAATALVPVVLLMGWLTYLSWPRLTWVQRALRALVLGGLTTWVVVRLAGLT